MAWSSPSAIGTAATSTGNTSFSPALPTYSIGDALFLVAGCRLNTTLGTLGTPAGYTVVNTQRSTGQSEIVVWAKKASASESAPTVTVTGATSGANIAFMFSASGGDVDNLGSIAVTVASATDATADTALDIAAITPGESNTLVLAVGFHNNNNSVTSGPTNYTNHANALNASGGSATLATAYAIQTAAAAIAADSWTMGGSAVQNSMVIALRQASASAIPTGRGLLMGVG